MTYKIGVLFDENGLHASDYLEGMEIPEGYMLFEGDIPDGVFRSLKLVDGVVVEGLTQAELDAIINAPQPKTDPEKIAALEVDNALLRIKANQATDIATATSIDFQALTDYLAETGVI
jgi:hypothetical protein